MSVKTERYTPDLSVVRERLIGEIKKDYDKYKAEPQQRFERERGDTGRRIGQLVDPLALAYETSMNLHLDKLNKLGAFATRHGSELERTV